MGHNKPTQLQNAGRVARKAAEIIRDRGHVVGALETLDGRVCAMRAIQLAVAPIWNMHQKVVAIGSTCSEFTTWLGENHPDTSLDDGALVQTWNDKVLKEETPLWLEKFADAVDPQ